MTKYLAIALALVIALGMGACKIIAQPSPAQPSTVELTSPALEVGPPNTVHALPATLELVKVAVTTSPALTLTSAIETTASFFQPTAPAPRAVAPIPAPVKLAPAPASVTSYDVPRFDRCEEDMPCWDCKTMGNLICGPLPVADTTAPVKPTACFTGWHLAEDGTCVNPEFYAPVTTPVTLDPAPETVVLDPAPVEVVEDDTVVEDTKNSYGEPACNESAPVQ